MAQKRDGWGAPDASGAAELRSALAEYGPEFAFAILLLNRAPLAQAERQRLMAFLEILRDPAQIRTALEVTPASASLLITYDFCAKP